jgi:hypothetical protein
MYILSILKAFRLGRQPKQGVVGCLRGPTPVRFVPWPRPSTFIGDVSPMNIIGYIRRFHVTDEYIVTFIDTDE